jgi:hypothetical protein
MLIFPLKQAGATSSSAPTSLQIRYNLIRPKP